MAFRQRNPKPTYPPTTPLAPDWHRKQAESSYLSEGRADGLRGNSLQDFVTAKLRKFDMRQQDKFNRD